MMPNIEVIDISDCTSYKKSAKSDKILGIKSLPKMPLKCNNASENKKRRRTKSKNKNSNVVTTFATHNESANESLSSLDEENNSALLNTSDNKSSTKQVSPSLQKLKTRHEELAIAVLKSRQAFSAHKLSTFFCLDANFISDFGENLHKAELNIQTMGQILAKVLGQPIPDLTTQTLPNSRQNSVGAVVVSETVELEKAAHPPGSLTPPSSEVGNDDDHISNMTDSTQTNKRKSESFNDNIVEAGKQGRKLRKCIVTNPVSAQKIVDKTAANFKEIETENDDETSTQESVEEEYEVRKIQDYIKKQGSCYYRVSWRGYESEDDTYEPADHLDGCEEVLNNFFVQRIKDRLKASMPDELKQLLLPSDEKVKDMLCEAFETALLPLTESDKEKAWKLVTSVKKTAAKSKAELTEDILKFVVLKDPSSERYKKLFSTINDQILMKEIGREREKQLAELRAWERSINMVSSDPALLTVENNVDLDLPPMDFIYINGYLAGPNINIPNDPVAGCECSDCNLNQKDCCANQMGSYFAYNKYGRLRISLGTPIYECNKLCKCPPDCSNRIVQKGRRIPLSIFKTSNGRGWGVKTLEAIKKDTFVTEYVGEVISSEEAEERGRKYDAQGCTYLFDLDYNKGDLNPYTVDAAKYGNVSHYINHCCDPNLVVFNVWVNCLDPDLPKLALFTSRDIKKGEEITFDYNSGSTRQIYAPRLELCNEGGRDSAPSTPTKLQFSPSKLTTPNKNLSTPSKNGDLATLMYGYDVIRKTPKNRGPNAGKTICRCGAANCRQFFF